MIRVVHPGSGFFTHPGSRDQKGTGSRVRYTANFTWNLDLFPAIDEIPSLQPLPHLVPPLRLGVRQELGEYKAVVAPGQRLIFRLLVRLLHGYTRLSQHTILPTSHLEGFVVNCCYV